jgi:hypothetical protein
MPAASGVKGGGADGVSPSGPATRARGIMPPESWPLDRRLPRESTDGVKSVFGSSRGRVSPGVSMGRKGAAMRTRWKSSPLAPRARQQAKSISAKEQHRRAMIVSKAPPLGGISSPCGVKEVPGAEVRSPDTVQKDHRELCSRRPEVVVRQPDLARLPPSWLGAPPPPASRHSRLRGFSG